MSALSDIQNRRVELQRISAAVAAELEELAIAEVVINRLAGRSSSLDKPSASDEGLRGQLAEVASILKFNGTVWADQDTVREAAVGRNIKESNFAPLLSKLKARGLILREGRRVAWAARVDPDTSSSKEEAGPVDEETGPVNQERSFQGTTAEGGAAQTALEVGGTL